jgi:hypothetical protein
MSGRRFLSSLVAGVRGEADDVVDFVKKKRVKAKAAVSSSKKVASKVAAVVKSEVSKPVKAVKEAAKK